ncbi:MAG: tetratricopeptide repeat protein [Thermoanaerobaculia bacterium]
MALEPGSRVGPYEIIAELGAGGMGLVYRARDPHLGRELAIKMLPADNAATPEQLRRFEQEARSASQLNHSSVVTIYDVGRDGAQHYIAMELVEGETLRAVLSHGPLAPREAARIAGCIADALAAAHEKGIVHRDLKPENVMLTAGGNVKILDFGLARLIRAEASPDEVTLDKIGPDTMPGAILGTTAYMSPEQASGLPAGPVSDQFSLGVILYEMLAGSRPFQRAGTIETLHAIIREDPPAIGELNPSVPERLVAIISRLLCKRPGERYGSTRDLAIDLQEVQEGWTPGAISAAPAIADRPRRTRGAMIVAIVAAVILAGAALWQYFERASRPAIPGVKSIAVLPFSDLSGHPGGDLYSRGISETISARLASVPDLQIMPPSSSRSAGPVDYPKLGRETGATMFLNGSVQRSGDVLRVTYSLIDANGVQLAAATVPGNASDLFLLQDQLAERVVETLELRSRPMRRSNREGLVTAADQDRYVEAHGLLQRYESEESVDQGIVLLEQLAERVSESAMVHAALGRAYLYKFKLTMDADWMGRAVAACERGVRLDPQRADIHITLGELHVASGRHAEAIESFRRALSQQPNSAEATLGLGQAYSRARRYEDAERTYRRAISLMPEWWAGYNRLGVLFMSQGRFADAVPEFQEVIELTPDNTRGYNNLGAAYLQLGRLREAERTFNDSVSVSPNSDALGNLGYLLFYEKRYAEAADKYEKAVALSPNDYLLWLSMGDSYRWAAGGKERSLAAYANAIRLADAALKTNPVDVNAHVTRALAAAKSGRIEEARKSIRSVLDISADDVTHLYYAAVVENLAGNPAEAVKLLTTAVQGGFPPDQIEHERDFENLKGRKDFQALGRQA